MSCLGGRHASLAMRLCRSSILHSQLSRAFTTTPYAAQASRSPNSPNYVDYPHPELFNITHPNPLKGTLPVPRDVFEYRRQSKDKLDKGSPEFIARATVKPTRIRNRRPPGIKLPHRVKFERRMSARRRQNLEDGLTELKRRKTQVESLRRARGNSRSALAYEARTRPTPDDELFTSSTVDPKLLEYLKDGASTRSSSMWAIQQRKRNHEKYMTSKSTSRLNDLHTLYMQARTFITNEEDLSKAVDKAFDARGTGRDPKTNLWPQIAQDYQRSVPPTIEGLQRSQEQVGATTGQKEHETAAFRRMKALAEELTGGRL